MKSHGVGKIASLNLGDMSASPDFEQHGPVLRVNGNGMSGLRLFRVVADRVVPMVRQYGVAIAGAVNFTRYSSLYPYTEKIAKAGYVSIMINSAGPPAVAPFGSYDPITGTNPLCISIPSAGTVQTFDMTTAEVVWGEIRQAELEGRPLRGSTFYSVFGEFTTDPNEVHSVMSFGGARGFAINLAIEMFCGPLLGAPGGLSVKGELDCGALLLAIDPGKMGAKDDFGSRIASLLGEVRAASPLRGSDEVRAPGDRNRGRILIEDHLRETFDIADSTVSFLERMGRGEKIAELSSNPKFN
ncbi:MAG: Ldh family oxidoreductase [Micrococcales bacterium]|nr:Ldh family oxidoreductase [Micrococcales bacterium]